MRSYESMRKWLAKQAEGKTIRQLESELDIPRSTLHRIIKGEFKSAKQSTLEKIASAMGPAHDEVDWVKGTDFVAVIVDENEQNIKVKTSIENKERALSLMAVSMGKICLSDGFSENYLIGLVVTTYRAMKQKEEEEV